MPTQAQRSASARRRLIEAATDLIADRGASHASVALIGERAGMSRGAVNFHFGSKDELLSAVAEDAVAAWDARSAKLELPEDEPLDNALRTLLGGYLDDIASDEEHFRVFAMLSFEALGPTPHLTGHFAALDRRIRERLSALLTERQQRGEIDAGLDIDAFSVVLLGMLRGVGLQHLLDPAAIDIARALDELVAVAVARLTP